MPPALNSLKVSNSNFFIKSYEGTRNDKLRIVVSKKVAPKAVSRNRIKRIIKEALKKMNLPQNNFTIIVRNNVEGYKSQKVEEELKQLLKQ